MKDKENETDHNLVAQTVLKGDLIEVDESRLQFWHILQSWHTNFKLLSFQNGWSYKFGVSLILFVSLTLSKIS